MIPADLQQIAELLPKANKEELVRLYLREQSSYGKVYASQGAPGDTSVVGDRAEPVVTWMGLATPVLRPRVAQRLSRDSNKGAIDPDSRKDPSPKKPPNTKRAKPLIPSSSSEEEHQDAEKRLAERRNHKKLKRHIVRESSPQKVSKSKTSKASSKPTNVPAALALMHGIKPSNIGRNRITQPVHLGVFRKGMASKPSNKRNKNEIPKPHLFDELEFLTRGRKKDSSPKTAHRATRRRSSSLKSSEGINRGETPSNSHSTSSPKAIALAKKIEIPTAKIHVNDKPSGSQTASQAQSEIWDIESCARATPEDLPDVPPSHVSAAPSVRTFLLAKHPWERLCTIKHEPPAVQPTESSVVSANSPNHEGSVVNSIRPSESASHLHCPPKPPSIPLPSQHPQISRFFVSEPVAHTPDSVGQEEDRSIQAPLSQTNLFNPPAALVSPSAPPVKSLVVSSSPLSLDDAPNISLPLKNDMYPHPSPSSPPQLPHPDIPDDIWLASTPTYDPLVPPLSDEYIGNTFFSSPRAPTPGSEDPDWDTDIFIQEAFLDGRDFPMVDFMSLDQNTSDPSCEEVYLDDFADEYHRIDLVGCNPYSNFASPMVEYAQQEGPVYGRERDKASLFPEDVTDLVENVVEEDPLGHESSSEIADDDSSLTDDANECLAERFTQGRAMLLGLKCGIGERYPSREIKKVTRVAEVERDVAKRMVGHWYPNRL